MLAMPQSPTVAVPPMAVPQSQMVTVPQSPMAGVPQSQMVAMPQSPTVAVPPGQSGMLGYCISPAQTPMASASPTECGHMAYGMSSPDACQQDLRFGAPLRYVVVASPVGMHAGNFEFGFDASDAQHVW